ncbi:MAG TPA: universal stress protein [Candidatus Limnocylindria bacterium]
MRILLATDFSHYADIARALVKSLALPSGSEVRLVHAIEPVTTVAMFAPAAITTLTEAAESEAKSEVKKIAKELDRPELNADAVVGFGRAADVVIDEAESFKPDLIVVGSRGRGGIATGVLGSVSAEIIDRASCPVLVARRETLSKVVLAEDGSAFAAAGGRALTGLPPFRGAEIRVVSVVDVPFPVVFADPGATGTAVEAFRAYEEAMPKLRRQHATYANERAKSLVANGLSATAEQREGDAASEIIAAAREQNADCIVVGSRGQTGLRRLMLGSVARSVLFHAPCSVLVVHERTAPGAKQPEATTERIPAHA